ncbi:hypothetical protein HMPREF0653_02221, partial [Prevotella disiens JCM 6334 = ATCC 29426]
IVEVGSNGVAREVAPMIVPMQIHRQGDGLQPCLRTADLTG